MANEPDSQLPDRDPQETQEWLEAVDDIVAVDGPERARHLLTRVARHARNSGVPLPRFTQTPYVNTIAPNDEPAFEGDHDMERQVRRIIRWNAAMMVGRANKQFNGIGGHLSSFASSANLYEMGFNHFFRGRTEAGSGDLIYYQGHAVPGMYSRAFLEGRLTEEALEHFRRETGGKGLPSYPHPWLLPDFWQFPTVSMGLGPIHSIYQARFNRYLHNRGLKDTSNTRVWAFLGDGECDEVETTGAISVASREKLNNLVFVINCNLQRLDGPVRGNSNIIQELESTFSGAGWEVIKVIWGPEWDALFAADEDGLLVKRLGEIVDGQYQKYTVSTGAFIRQDLFGTDPRLLKLVEHMSDEEITHLRRGGHSDSKLFAAYSRAVQSDRPVCILAQTVKGWTLGGGFEASNVTHQMKKLDETQLLALRDRLEIPLDDDAAKKAPYYHPGKDSPEVRYLKERRLALGGTLPHRSRGTGELKPPEDKPFTEFFSGSKGKVEVSTTMAFVRLLRNLLRDPTIGKHVVPIIPDEGRTFGMDPFFREFGIYASQGQKYTPVDAEMLLNYHEAQDGQLLEEGITEAGSMASFIAAGTSYSTHDLPMVPFYIFYSMFGLQRTGDQVWSAGDARTRGFLLGATAGRTTLHGEGLQHDDGHSHLLAQAIPNLVAYDPAFAYETAIIIQDGLKRMLGDHEDIFYYITLYNENYTMPAMPKGCEKGVLRGLYLFEKGDKAKHAAQILASGPFVNVAIEAQKLLADYDVSADVWSATSYQQLFRDARHVERHNRLHPGDKPKVPYVTETLSGTQGPIVSVSDWVTEIPSLLSRFMPRRFMPLGTNGFGRSDTREALREHFEIDAPAVAAAVLYTLLQEGTITAKVVQQAYKRLGIDSERPDPMNA